MNNYRITTDSTVDLGKEYMDEHAIPYVTLFFKFGEEQSKDDMTVATGKRIYDAMRKGSVITTSQAIAEDFISLWTPMLEAGEDILYIGFSSGLSGTVNSAALAKNTLMEKFPDRRIAIVDSLCASGGEGMLLRRALDKQAEGAGFDECLAFVEDLKLRVNHWYTVSELVYLKRGGRVKASKAIVADILGIKPVMKMDNMGHLVPHETIKGRKAAIRRMAEHLEELVDIGDNPYFGMTHADCIEDAEYLRDIIHEKHPDIPMYISQVGAVIGAHCGPGTLALFFVGKPRTDD